jgi:hypothetical protein
VVVGAPVLDVVVAVAAGTRELTEHSLILAEIILVRTGR